MVLPVADRRLIILAFFALACVIAFMTLGLRGNYGFILTLRAMKLAALIEVGIAIALSTIIFQTITANRILTPSIMGIDALYLFAQVALVFILGGIAYAQLDVRFKFMTEVTLLMGLSAVLIFPMLRRQSDIGLMLLAGVVFGILFRSLHSLVARMIDPNDFAVAQGSSYADFSNINTDLLVIGSLLIAAAFAVIWRHRHILDVMALGQENAIGLGIDWRRMQVGSLLLVSILVSVSTALVGPVAFLGLLIVSLAESILKTRRHGPLMAASSLIAVIVLVGGQTVFQHVLGNSTTLGVIIEFAGGIVFLLMLWRGSRP